MDFSQIATPVILMAVLGGGFAFLLGVVSKLTYIEVDPRETAVREALPGVNCGACGYPGCDGCAAAIVKGEAPTNACVVGGAPVAEKIGEIMGSSASIGQRYVASVKCQGSPDHNRFIYEYDGVQDCRIMATIHGGCKACRYGCLGCGTCVTVCDFDAIHIVNGIALVDQEKCTACKKCIEVCPKKIIELTPYNAVATVKCSNPEFGKAVSGNCNIGCIGCGLCAKLAPDEFALDGKLAHATYHDGFDIEKAKMAAAKCPAKCIVINENGDVNAKPVEIETKETVNA